MKFLQIFIFLSVAIATSACFRNDRRTGEFLVPQLNSQECLTYLSGKLRAAEGVELVEGDLEKNIVRVTFNGLKLALKNIEIVIAEAGFDVNDRPAEARGKASMPAACR
jgi:copper chaperone CopZ